MSFLRRLARLSRILSGVLAWQRNIRLFWTIALGLWCLVCRVPTSSQASEFFAINFTLMALWLIARHGGLFGAILSAPD
jgi:hypothetical protein